MHHPIGIASPEARGIARRSARGFQTRFEWGAAPRRDDQAAYRAPRQDSVFFGSAISNFGVEELLRASSTTARATAAATTRERSGRC